MTDWTEPEIEQVRQCVSDGYSARDIALKLREAGHARRSRSAICGVIHRNNMRASVPLTSAEVVERRRQKHKLASRTRSPKPRRDKNRPWTEEENALLMRAFREGKTDVEIADLLDDQNLRSVTPSAVAHQRGKFNLKREAGFSLAHDPAKVGSKGSLAMLIDDWAVKHPAGPTAGTLLELAARPGLRCSWPVGVDGGGLLCGAPRMAGSSYCDHHRSVAVAGSFDIHKALGWKAAS